MNKSTTQVEVFHMLGKLSTKKKYKSLYEFHNSLVNEAQDNSFYTIDFADLLWKNQLWKENFPKVKPYYAVKANPDPQIIRFYTLLGYGFDCSTEGEIRLVLASGCDPTRIIFAHTVKAIRALQWTRVIGLRLMTVDSEEEIRKIHEHHPEAKLVIRIKSSSKQTVYNLSKKFGCGVSEAEILLKTAKDLGLEVVGISFHVGALCSETDTFVSSLEHSRQVFDIAETLGFSLNIIDIGAGFFGTKEHESFFYELSDAVNTALQSHFSSEKIQWIAEPGTFCVCSAVTLTTAVLGVRQSTDEEKNESIREYFINDGFYGSFFDHIEIYDVKPVGFLTRNGTLGVPTRSRIWGQTCCSEDLILDQCLIPTLSQGDLIIWSNMGAYSSGCCSNFTSVPMPQTKYVYVRDNRIKTNHISNISKVLHFVSEVSTLVENDILEKTS